MQKFEYLENEKSFLDEIKNVFHSLWRAIIWLKIKNLWKIADTSFKVLKLFKISSDCHIKACRSLKWRAILKIPILKEPMLFMLALKWNLYEKAFSCVETKINWHLTNLFSGESNIWYPSIATSLQHFTKRSWNLQSFSFSSEKFLRVMLLICWLKITVLFWYSHNSHMSQRKA